MEGTDCRDSHPCKERKDGDPAIAESPKAKAAALNFVSDCGVIGTGLSEKIPIVVKLINVARIKLDARRQVAHIRVAGTP
jgi:hypothetical protein